MNRALRSHLLLAALLPVSAWAIDGGSPLEAMSSFVPTPALPAVAAHEGATEDSTPLTLAVQANAPSTPAPKPAASAVAPKPDAERRPRRQAERLDRPPFIRPM